MLFQGTLRLSLDVNDKISVFEFEALKLIPLHLSCNINPNLAVEVNFLVANGFPKKVLQLHKVIKGVCLFISDSSMQSDDCFINDK